MYIPLKPLFSRHKGIGVQFTDDITGIVITKVKDDDSDDHVMYILMSVPVREDKE